MVDPPLAAQKRSKNDLGRRSVPGPLKVGPSYAFLEPCGATWAILDVILGPAWSPGARKIKHFRTKTPKSREKLRPGEGLEKTLKFHRILMRKCEVLGMLNHGISSITM